MKKNVIGFIKSSYPSVLNKILVGLFIAILIGTWGVSVWQESTINDRIATRKAEIESDYKAKVEDYKRNYAEEKENYENCKQAHKNDSTYQFYDPCFLLSESYPFPLSSSFSADRRFNALQDLKSDLDSDKYWSTIWFPIVALFVLLVLAIPLLRLAVLAVKKSWQGAIKFRTNFRQMMAFQKYVLILSILCLIALVIIIVRLF